MSSPPVPAASSHLPGGAGAAASAATKQTGNVSGLMAAIQCVLEEHNVANARFILELPPAAAAATTSADAAALSAGDAHVREIQRASKALLVTASIDSPASNTEGGGANSTLLIRTQTTPAVAPPPPPEHQQPPPRARTPSPQAQSLALQQPHLFPKPSSPVPPAPHPGTAPQEDSVSSLGATMSPAAAAVDNDAKETRVPRAATAQEEPVSAIPTKLLAKPSSPPSRCPDDSFSAEDAATALADDDATSFRLVSNQLAHDMAIAEAQMSRKEILRKFVGRSAILDYRRQREAQMHGKAPKVPLSGTLHPGLPRKEDAAGASTKPPPQPRRVTAAPADKCSSRRPSAHAANCSGSAASVASAVLSPPSPPDQKQQPCRRSVVRLTPPPPSASLSSGGFGVRSTAMPDSSSLPSLVSAKKSAVPGKTPVFSILNKDGSRLFDQGTASVTPRSSLFGATPAGGASAAPPGAATSGGAPIETSWSSSNGNNTSVSHSRHSHPGSVCLRADDRVPPSPVHEPLLGTAAEEEANRQRSILVQTQLRTTTQEPQVLESEGTRGSEKALPKLWSEQSKENASRASRLQSQSRLSNTMPLDSLSLRCAAATTTVLGKHQTGTARDSPTVLSPRPPSRMPSSLAEDASARPSLRAMLQEQQQLHEASRRSMEEHNRLMQAARVVRTSPPTSSVLSNTFEASKTSTVELVTSPGRAAAAAISAADAAAAAKEGDPAQRTADIATSPAVSNTSVTSAPSAPGIHVVKFTLPHDQEARQAAVQQLCRSSAGTQHVDTKERYRALLAAQQEEFTAQEAKAQNYRELLNRAVEFNRFQQRRQNPKPS
ncbi:hypothetical protein LSCM1_05504 [Leishmania martiniquensis]|uniref:Uncharacterized protein n=1 Tax=Leishmania martiniquensis TaxID=1580590 RepID=A0A836H8G5_9TRYP|nr:hypothetical protein LSCM1_05504 [Leishmania martiniquensis]